MDPAADIETRVDAASKAGPHLSAIQKAMLDATPDLVAVMSLDGKLLMMNRAGCLALSVPEDSEFGMSWLSLLPEDVHPAGIEALRKAAAGQTAHFHGRSISRKGIIHWDNLLIPLDASGQGLSILCVSRDVTAKTLLERQLKEEVDREKLLAREMHHRIKNLFSVVSALISISMREAALTDGSESPIGILREKLGALSLASDAVFAQDNGGVEDADPVDLEAVVTSVLRPYGNRCAVIGTTASIRRDIITTFALLLHELATNSVKYGALSKDNGNVTVRWMVNDDSLDLTWIEIGAPQVQAPPKARGFGTEMVDRLVASTGGAISRTWRTEGLVVDLHFPRFTQA
ncbi:Two-component sensor histidine kinase, contains HisKA and HATPase domains [Bradyrhizobium brasilense]|uniref:Blue-light-activated histidine kinase n=1 Tax=Bradyrhizobium brasilense TaxID=1419277 RepID=A0A1G6RR34_9BRAD|nr:PAS domain-containing protein [Bradyrhizobium brasilense]SDD06406.1 Two-component sensor histidine kinase, contains HisKA and HATPase domains [Bradyrhizobium brasilense]